MTFLAALALALAGFSIGLYLMARAYLHRQVNERVEAALATLAATCELESDGLDWEPIDHHLRLGQESGVEQIRWEVRDEEGQPVDRSANLGSVVLWEEGLPAPADGESVSLRAVRDGQPWRIGQRLLRAWRPTGDAQRSPADMEHDQLPQRRRYPALLLLAGVSLVPVHRTLEALGLTLGGLSTALWITAALVGRRVSRRALAPLTQMALSARDMGASDLNQRLPTPGTQDELDELALAFNGLLGRVQEAFERQRRFTGDASHQLRTPLTAMLGQVEVALRRDRPPEEYRRALEVVQGQAGQLRRIVEALLYLARADAETEPDATDVVDLAAWLPEYLRQWSTNARASDLRAAPVEAGSYSVRIQPLLLGQLLDNLVDNAFKYSEPGTLVTVSLEREAGVVLVRVEDTGCGIAPVDLPHIFEPFYRSAEIRRLGRSGVGLGLAMVRRIATAFKGSILAESQPGRGSRFTLRLPLMATPLPQEGGQPIGPSSAPVPAGDRPPDRSTDGRPRSGPHAVETRR
jgi:signal transduction histidine kinase